MNSQEIFEAIVKKRGITNLEEFLKPKYEKQHDSALLPDIKKAIKRIKLAYAKKQKVVVYGDYDIDGLTATTILMEALAAYVNTQQVLPTRQIPETDRFAAHQHFDCAAALRFESVSSNCLVS